MLEHLDRISWVSLRQPDWNHPAAVPDALRALAACASEAESRSAYDRVLYALGNNHAGTYYPVVLAALPFIGEILERGGSWARVPTLEILTDLAASFRPEPGFEMVTTADGGRSELKVLVRQAVAAFSPLMETIVSEGAPGSRERELAAELLAEMKEVAGDS
jgi:hypothetical protein